MRKLTALAMVALLALTLALAAVGCAQQEQHSAETPATTETHDDMATDTSMASDTMMADTTMGGH